MLQGGGIAYDATAAATGKVAYNTMTTPKGRQFQVTLPDGTKVWLNAASSIRYPTVFNDEERKVEVMGEVYFEVARAISSNGEKKPFIVDVLPSTGRDGIQTGTRLEVLGTHFNVNAYNNEVTINTTLLEGSVRVSQSMTAQPAVTLKPGQQAQVYNYGGVVPIPENRGKVMKVINDADINKIMAWKNGLFNFEGASFAEVMGQLERWYDVEIVYEKTVPDIEFEGKMTRDVPLHDLLKMLERSDIHFRIEGRKLIVLP